MARKPKPPTPPPAPSVHSGSAHVDPSGEERFRALLEDLHVGVALLGAQAEVQFANRAAANIFGMTLEEVLGKTSDEINLTGLREDGSEFPFPLRPVPQVLESGEPIRDRLVGYRRRDSGETFWIFGTTTPQLGGDGSVRGVIATFTDVTAWKHAEDKLRESEERFRKAFESSAIGMALVALDGRWLRVNESLCRIVGYTPEEMLAMDFQSITHPDDLGPDIELARRVIAGQLGNFHVEKRYLHKDGRIVWVLLSVSMVRDRVGNPLYFVSQIQDITDRKRTDSELRSLSTRLLELQEEERRRIARDLHDSFAQTLLGIGLNLAQLDESRNLKGRREKRILAETRKMIKALSRETRSLSYLLHPPLLDEMGLVSAIEEYARGYSARSGIRLELDLDSNTGRLPREIETAIFRVIQEALGNIQKHSGSATAAIRLNKRENKITLEVKDQGRGIHNGEVQKGNLSTRQLGVGILGMRERMHQLGGQLEVVSTDSGTVVRATLPLPTGVEDAAANSDRR